ncbi:hypothetical protein [Marispirochaeta sp.]|uniref:hypothetical protein n=1 Tax=Marispirochaeta sp. TaxID=2038653 RepID=UPI0029C8C7DA|nr:hypothetical protein [Marispirochaeta sp.]
MIDLEKLRFRRQFILGPAHVQLFYNWQKISIGNDLFLTVHPDLPCYEATIGNVTTILLGYAVNPYLPNLSNTEIVNTLSKESTNWELLIKHTNQLVGRWVIIYKASEKTIVFHDPAGVRQIHFGFSISGELWCASQPSLVALVTDAEPDLSHHHELKNDGVFDRYRDHFWPGSTTFYKKVFRLLPNHYLDMYTRKPSRYWPVSKIEEISFDDAIVKCSKILTGSIKAATKRYNLLFSITAGFDSRVLLAASRDVVNELKLYTEIRKWMHPLHPDIRVPYLMLRSVGLNRKLLRVPKRVDRLFQSLFTECFPHYHEGVLKEADVLFKSVRSYGFEPMVINGNISEIGRRFYSKKGWPGDPTPELMSAKAQMKSSRYAAEQFSYWYEDAKPTIKDSGIDPWDLFYWEQKIGGWFGSVRSEYDFAIDVFLPYNCRDLLQYMLGVNPLYRQTPDYKFHESLIRYMWPELLHFSINPPDPMKKIVKYARRIDNFISKIMFKRQ